ncbi:MAG TPA: MFS transporter [Frankiaceae bacterium]|nr:MFS transporter [Frankiaceae bacterium]
MHNAPRSPLSAAVHRPRWAVPSPLRPLYRVAAAAGAGDALVAVALANTVFFRVPVGEARGRVALYLLLTMAPFALLAPLVGPLLDRTRARRGAIAATFGGRAVLAAFIAAQPTGLRIYPAAFAVLVLAKAYGVAKSAAVPRLLPENGTLVTANARVSAFSIGAGSVAGVVGFGLGALAGYSVTLRLAALVFAIGAALVLLLPREVDIANDAAAREHVRLPRFPASAKQALVGALSVRALAGFLTTYLAFLFRSRDANVAVGLLAVAVALGSAAGTGLGAGLRRTAPERLLTVAVAVAAACCAIGAWRFSAATALLAALAAAVAGSLAKIGLDATLQREVGEDVRAQAFARSETALQLAWVAGGGAGLALPLGGPWGLGLAAVALVAATVWARMRVARSGSVD